MRRGELNEKSRGARESEVSFDFMNKEQTIKKGRKKKS